MQTAALTAFLCLLAVSLEAQAAPPISVGQRIWVRSRTGSGRLDPGIKGSFEGFNGDSVQLRGNPGAPVMSVGFSPSTRYFVYSGRVSSDGRGAAIGVIVGALTGAVIGFAVGQDCTGRQKWFCFDRGGLAKAGAVVLGGAGLIVGIIAGAQSTHESWKPAGLPGGIHPVVLPGSGGLGVGFSLAF